MLKYSVSFQEDTYFFPILLECFLKRVNILTYSLYPNETILALIESIIKFVQVFQCNNNKKKETDLQ